MYDIFPKYAILLQYSTLRICCTHRASLSLPTELLISSEPEADDEEEEEALPLALTSLVSAELVGFEVEVDGTIGTGRKTHSP